MTECITKDLTEWLMEARVAREGGRAVTLADDALRRELGFVVGAKEPDETDTHYYISITRIKASRAVPKDLALFFGYDKSETLRLDLGNAEKRHAMLTGKPPAPSPEG